MATAVTDGLKIKVNKRQETITVCVDGYCVTIPLSRWSYLIANPEYV